MKDFYRLGVSLLFTLVYCLPTSYAKAHNTIDSEKKHKALNQYVALNNECIHVLNGVRKRLEGFNQNVIEYMATDGANPLQFRIHDMFDHFQFHSAYHGACLWVEKQATEGVNIQYLYEATTLQSQHIPQADRNQLNGTRNDIMFLMIEFLSLCDTLENYTSSGRYRSEPELKTAFWALNRCETLYKNFRDLNVDLYDQVMAIADPEPAELKEMRNLIAHSQEIIQAVRYENHVQVGFEINKLESLIEYIEGHEKSLRKNLDQLGLDFHDGNSGYDNMVVHAKSIIKAGRAYMKAIDIDPAYYAYGKGYYYFNHNLLDAYNHHKYGMLAYYNRFLSFANMTLVKMVEEPPVFRVIYEPANETPNMLVSEVPPMAAMEKSATNRRPTLAEMASGRRYQTNRVSAKATAQAPNPTVASGAQETLVASTGEGAIPEILAAAENANTTQAQASLPDIQTVKTTKPGETETITSRIRPNAPKQKMTLAGAATNHLIFLVDVSSSMNKPEKLPLLKKSLAHLVTLMRPEDRITLIAYAGKASIRLEAVSASNTDIIFRELENLKTGGKTNMRKGLKLAYQLAGEHFIPNGNNRVILASDGMINLSKRAEKVVEKMAWEDVTLSTFHLTKGSSPMVQKNLTNLAEIGAGNYHLLNEQTADAALFQEATAVMRPRQ